MEPDCYKIEVVYYFNPHLIWIEVFDPSSRNRKDEYVFEQIGVYGLLPFETTLEIAGSEITGQRCAAWVPAAAAIMREAFSEAKNIYFSPILIEHRSTIFDNNIHKFGEIIIETSGKEQLKLSQILAKSGFAMFDVCLFHQELSTGGINTKLTRAKATEVMRHLLKGSKHKEQIKNSIKKQTTVLQTAQIFESELTAMNLELHNRRLKASAVEGLIERKMKDFNLCKDIDEEPLIAANRSGEAKQKLPLFLKKKLESHRLSKNKVSVRERPKNQDPIHVLNATKKFLEENIKHFNDSSLNASKMEKSGGTAALKTAQDCKQENIIRAEPINSCEVIEVAHTESSAERNILSPTSKRGKNSKKSTKIPEYNISCESRIAMGPPGLDVTRLPLKIVPKIQENESFDKPVSIEHKEEEVPKVKGLYDDVDSNINIEITNKGVLFNSLHTSVGDSAQLDKSYSDCAIIQENYSLNTSASNENAVNFQENPKGFSVLQRKLQFYNQRVSKQSDSSTSSSFDTTNKDSTSTSLDESKPVKDEKKVDTDSDYLDPNDNIAEIIEKINNEYGSINVVSNTVKPDRGNVTSGYKNNVNPFKNIDDNMSVFVDKLVSPVLMVHTKMNKRIEPSSNIRDVNFNTHVHIVLKSVFCIEKPMILQMVSWPVILRGFSMFMISSLRSGKTLGYLPAVCSLVTDSHTETNISGSVGPTCIIVCATAQSVTQVEEFAKRFLGLREKVLSCYAGVNDLDITTSLLNGCDLFICTPPALSRLLKLTTFGIDLRRLTTMVLDDCERLSEVYKYEIKFILFKINEMYKSRINKESKVQFIIASQIWCDLMEPIIKKAPNSVICIGAFQECVLYAKSSTTVEFVQKDKKFDHILEYLKTINITKRVVVVCRSDTEVIELEKALLKQKYFVIACNSAMTVEELYNLNLLWADYRESVTGPFLVCCDGNLTHLNITDAYYLIHYSLPQLFSMFCKRFSVLNDNYSSVFKEEKPDIKIKVLIDEDNVEQLPKILHFVKRCTSRIPEHLGKISEKIINEKDMNKGKKLIPLCDRLLTLGECPEFWNCSERHTVFKEYDQPKNWMPTNGIIKFQILHYHSAVHYSARLLSHTINSETIKYLQTYSSLQLRMGIYYSSDTNKKLHGTPNVGDFCAVSIKQNMYARCQVLKILSNYEIGASNRVLINLIDEERLLEARDIQLFHLPDDLKNIETSVVHVRLTNVHPKDKDITFSELAKDQLKSITDRDEGLYLRGQVILSVGNCVFVDTLEACQELTSLNETVVRYNFKKELLEKHAIFNPDHIIKIKNLCKESDIIKEEEVQLVTVTEEKECQPTPQWSHLENESFTEVYFSWAINPGTFFVRLTKFDSCIKLLTQDIDKYVGNKPVSINNVKQGQIVLAKFPGDTTYDRAKVYHIIDEHKVKCFFVDHGDFREVLKKDLLEIPDKFITQIPFQTIECFLIGLRPAADQWTEFATNWFTDTCLSDDINAFKPLFVQFFTKTSAAYTCGHKYGVALIDTTTDTDIFLNKLMVDLNLAQENKSEIHYFDDVTKILNIVQRSKFGIKQSAHKQEDIEQIDNIRKSTSQEEPVGTTTPTQISSLNKILPSTPIRSVPLVEDSDSDVSKWDIVNPAEFRGLFSELKDFSKEKNDFKAIRTVTSAESGNNTISKLSSPPLLSNENKESMKPGSANIANKPEKEEKSKKEEYHISANVASPENSKKLSILALDSDDYSSAESSLPEKQAKSLIIEVIDELRKPKLTWRQNKNSVTIKIQMIGVEKYKLDIQDKSMKFSTYLNDLHYGFNFELYGVIDSNSCLHSNKGTYILVKFNKVMKKNWLTLTKDTNVRKWVVYDVDSIDTSSDEEEEPVNHLAKIVKESHFKDNSESDDDFLDDVNDYNLRLD